MLSTTTNMWTANIRHKSSSPSPRNVVVTIDDTAESQGALNWALNNVVRDGDRLKLVTLDAGSNSWTDYFRNVVKDRAQLEADAKDHAEKIMNITMRTIKRHEEGEGDQFQIEIHQLIQKVRSGSMFTDKDAMLLDMAKSFTADIIIVGAHRVTGTTTSALDTAIRDSSCPVIVVREPLEPEVSEHDVGAIVEGEIPRAEEIQPQRKERLEAMDTDESSQGYHEAQEMEGVQGQGEEESQRSQGLEKTGEQEKAEKEAVQGEQESLRQVEEEKEKRQEEEQRQSEAQEREAQQKAREEQGAKEQEQRRQSEAEKEQEQKRAESESREQSSKSQAVVADIKAAVEEIKKVAASKVEDVVKGIQEKMEELKVSSGGSVDTDPSKRSAAKSA